MSTTLCYVTAKDYRLHWGPAPTVETPAPYTGPDRRAGADRRRPAHDRRWVASLGRRSGRERRTAR